MRYLNSTCFFCGDAGNVHVWGTGADFCWCMHCVWRLEAAAWAVRIPAGIAALVEWAQRD